MSLTLTPEIVEQAYEYLRATPPFRSWNLPDAEDVKFRIVRAPDVRGWYLHENGKHVIAISSRCIGQTDSLIRTLAHEMIHLYQRDTKIDGPRTQHNKAFLKIAARVAKIHGFDPKLF